MVESSFTSVSEVIILESLAAFNGARNLPASLFSKNRW